MCIACVIGFCTGITSDLVDRLRGLVVDTIWEQLLYLVRYDDNIDELNQQLKELEDKRRSVEQQIREAKNNGDKIKAEVLGWWNRVDEILEQAQNFEKEESQANSRCTCTQCPNMWSRHQLRRTAKEMALQIVEISGKNFDTIAYREPPEWKPDLTNIKSNEGINSRVSIMNQIMEALRDPSIKMIGLCGPGGVGKTTIAKEVAKKVKDEKMFEKVIMATISNHLDIVNIQGQIAEMLGMTLNERTESARASRLSARLEQEKNLLLILDDLWKELVYAEVGIPFIDGGKYNENNEGCKILLTSRNRTLLSDQMKCERNIIVGFLDEMEAWELFKSIAELSVDSSSPDLVFLAAAIVNECQGLPLAIVAAAKTLRKRDLTAWNDALKLLKNPLRRKNSEIEAVDKILRYSYDHLSPKQQHIFLLSAMLPHDCLIKDLFMYSVGLDLHEHVEDMQEAQDEIFTIVSELKASYLLLDSISNHHFTMHDVVRDVAFSIAFNERHFFVERHRKLKKWPIKNSLEGYKGICLEKCDIGDLPKELHGPGLEFFLFNSTNHNLTMPNMFFKSAKELKVLAFVNMHFSSLPSLRFLEELGTLCLHSCLLEDITEVRRLKNLNILSLAYSEIEQLPFELAELIYLQMLNLAHCSKLKVIPPKLLSSLKRLEVLHMENSFNQWEAEGPSQGNKNASLDELKHLPISSLDIHIPDASVMPKDLFLVNVLEKYRIIIGTHWRMRGNYETSKTLILKLQERCVQLESGLQKLLERVEDLSLDGSYGLANVLYNLDGRGFPHLKHLHIENNYDIEYIVFNSAHLKVAFPILETLELENLNGLKKLCEGPIAATFFQNLKVIKVRSCHQLKSIFSISMVGSFSQLVAIEIGGCDSLTEIVTSNIEDSFDEQNSATDIIIFHRLQYLVMDDLRALTDFNIDNRATNNECNQIFKSLFCCKVLLPKLEKLHLSNLNSLIRLIWDDRLLNGSFSNLKSLSVVRCWFVKLVPFQVLKSFNNLEELEVRDCHLLEVVFDFEELNNYKEIQSIVVVPLKRLELWALPKLQSVWSNDPQGIVSFRNLQQVGISSCQSLTSIFPASIAKDVLHLETLQIKGCGIDVIVAKDRVNSEVVDATFVFPRLVSLWLSELPNLRNFYPQRHTSEWPHLQQLSICDCDELEMFENEASSSSAIHQEDSTLDTKYPLLSHEKVIHLEKLRLSSRTAEMILNGQFSKHLQKVKEFHLLPGNASTFAYRFLKSFPNLEQLYLEGNMEEIFSSKEPLVDDAAAASLVAPFQILRLYCVRKVKHIWNQHSPPRLLQGLQYLSVCLCYELITLGPSFISLRNLTLLHVRLCPGLTYLLTSSTARSLVLLTSLTISDCDQIEEIITKQQGDDDEGKDIIFNRLQKLELYELPRLNSFCMHSYAFRFPLLDQVIISKCPRFKIFCPGDIYTPLLQGVQVALNQQLLVTTDQNKIKQWDTNLNNTIFQQFTTEEVINTLDELVLNQIDATMIRNDQFPTGRYPRVQTLHVESFVDEWIAFPYRFLEKFPELCTLSVKQSSFVEIFPSQAQIVDDMGKIPPFKQLHLAYLDQLKNIWNDDSQLQPVHQNLEFLNVESCYNLIKLAPSSASFENLTDLMVSSCHHLIYLVTSSTAKSLMNLQFLKIKDCKMMEEIVKNETNEDLEGEIIFNQLICLELTDLPSLRRFCPGVLEMQNLSTMEITQLLLLVKVVPSLEQLTLQENQAKVMWVGDGQLLSEKLVGDDDAALGATFRLGLVYLEKAKHIWNEHSPQDFLQGLEYLNVENCHGLISLGPSFISLATLTELRVSCCQGLTNLLTSSTATSLVHLTSLSINSCSQIEEIITKQQGDDEEKEIIFSQLCSLQLDQLPRLKSFCSYNDTLMFPSLHTLLIRHCPRFKIFSPGVIHTPSLQGVQVEEYQKIWDTNLNNTILQRFTTPEVTPTLWVLALNEFDATMIRNDQFPVDLYPKVEHLFVESFVDEWLTFPYRFLERFPKLDWLIVEHSSFEEIFPSQAQIVDHMGKISPFKKLHLAHLDQLKNIWNDDSQLQPIHHNLEILVVESCWSLIKLAPSSTSFENLTLLVVSSCHQLIYLVTCSTAKSLVNLEMLRIMDCQRIEVIVTNETNEDVEGGITFKGLRWLELTNLPCLKMFSSQSHPFIKFPELETLTITGCLQMKIFCPGVLETPKLSTVKIEDKMDWEDQEDLNKIIELQFSTKDGMNI